MTNWVRVADESEIEEGEPFASALENEAIALYRYENDIYAIGDICPHEDTRLSDGWLTGDRIECPLHQACFEIRTGKVIEGGPATEDVPAYAVRVQNGGVFVRRND